MPRRNNKGKIIGLMGITRDITRRMQLERLQEEKANIEEKIEALEEVNKVKSEFVSIVSHELRTPLAIIKEAVMLILDNIAGPVNEKQKELLNSSNENIERLKKIIDDLLDMSRLEGDRLNLHYALVNLKDLVKDTQEFFIKLALHKGIKLEYELPQEQINIFVDAERIRQVMNNLINNAIKFTEEDGNIKVQIDALETMVKVKVSDTGVGIAPSDLPKLFNKFVQVSKDTSAQRKGVGLGLAISKELVQRHGGNMWVESQLGVGSQFHFSLPLLYTRHYIPPQMRETVNSLIEKNILLSLIELCLVNYDRFKDVTSISPQQLIKDLENILTINCQEFSKSQRLSSQLFSHDPQSGEFSIVVPGASGDKIEQICNSFVSGIKGYLKDKQVKNIFTKIEILSWPFEKNKNNTKDNIPNISMKKMLVGLEARRFERIPFRQKVDVMVSPKNKETLSALDISQGGICLEGNNFLEKDNHIQLALRIPRQKNPIYTSARVAWVKNMAGSLDTDTPKYRAGLEFLNLTTKDKEVISNFINITNG
jgi:nitrogen-specific signal transduction histidine kinase